MNSSKLASSPLKDLTIDNITENTIRINSQCPDLRMTYVLERLVSHLHDFARETRLSSKEWVAGYEFLTAVGKICSNVRQVSSHSTKAKHFIRLFSDIYWNFCCSNWPCRLSKLTPVPGIHPALRHPWSLPPSRLHRPPQTTLRNRRIRPRALSLP